MKTKLRKWAPRVIGVMVAVSCVGLLIYGTYIGYLRRHQLDVLDNLDKTAATIDGEEMTLEDLGFYILFEEQKIEEEAYVYNSKRTKDFWNTHTNGFFLQGKAREAVIGMAIHDTIFYNEAIEAGVVLNTEEKETLENARTDFWSDLYDEQLERIPGTYDSVNLTIKKIAIAEKYQMQLADEKGTTFAGFSWDGYDYESDIKPKHDIKINDLVWKRVILGDITLNHDDISYLNAFDE